MTAFDQVKRELRAEFGAEFYRSWLEQLNVAGEHENVLYLCAPNTVVRDRVRQRALDRIEARLAQHMAPAPAAAVEVHADLPETVRAKAAPAETPTAALAAAPAPQAVLNQTFDSYCVGDANRSAVFAARAIAEGSAAASSLTIFHGPHGVGKTHLANAIMHEAQRRNPARRVRYMMTTLFIEEFQAALQKRRDMSAFKAALRDVDLLILDDVQRAAQKPATENELVDTIAVLLANGAQIVMTADHGPAGLDGFDVRLRSQLRGATDFLIDAPDLDLRRKILDAKVRLYADGCPGFHVPAAVLDMIACRIKGPGRLLDAAIRQLVLELSPVEQEVTMESAERVLRSRFAEPERRPTVDVIIDRTAKHYQLTKEQLLTPTHQRSIARPRQVAMYLCRKMTRRSLPDLAKRFGGKHHTTVLYAAVRIEDLIAADDHLRRDIETIERTIRSGP